jgi:hypothetical protein
MLACDGKLFFSNGTVLDANDCSQIGSLSAQPGRSAMAAVPQTHTLFMANLGKVIALDSTTLQPKGSISLPFTVGRIIPFGSEGLMVVESGSQVAYLIKASDLH